ncbi:MAG: DUF1559 domain-containing protein, partial [Candidatus Omnitrophica bacterium]|nr:DUF1559 domain-containing protein [Candidatus Omnitrophota bacterium]
MGQRRFLLPRKSGQTFLLIILVVIGIGAMLLVLLLPTTVAIREAEKRFSCMKNLKTIGQAIQLYAADFNGCLPFGLNSSNLLWDGLKGEKLNLGRLYPGYLKQPQAWYCPSQKFYREDHPDYGYSAFGSPGKEAYGSYLVRGGKQFDETLSEETPLYWRLYPDKVAWVADYNIPQTEMVAHKGRGV